MRIEIGVTTLARGAAVVGIGIAACVGLLVGSNAQAGVPSGAPTTHVQASKIALDVLQETSGGKSASVIVLLTDQADVSAAHGMKDQDARGWYVYTTLTKHAERTQAGLRAFLSSQGVKYRSFWAANMMEVTADRALVESLAARSDVKGINSNRPQRWIEPEEVAKYGVTDTPAVPGVVEWGVQNVNAPQVWAMGFTGQGLVVGGLDTGIRWTHNALRPQYRGWNGATADHNYNWWDAIHSGGGVCGPNTQAPCDDNGHGSSTIGSATGNDGGTNQIGVAPGAKWIGCRNMDQGNGTPATYTECFQFMIAPTDLTGQNPNPALRPHVLVNSWLCPVSEGCTTGDELRIIVENTQATGIFVQASAVDHGPSCSTLDNPPAMYEASFAAGAYNINNTLAAFSGRGPVTRDGSNRVKPNISAPGVNVRSATSSSDTAYGNVSSTSMAAPHVSGVVALLWSARPQLLRDIATTKNVLQNTANPNVSVSATPPYCGDTPPTQIPNNYFGYGRVDALAAVNSVGGATPTGTVVTSTPAPATSTTTSTATVTPCPMNFTDVFPTDYFYEAVRYLYCRGVISGYSDGTFRPYNNTTRGQLTKIVVLAFGFEIYTPPVPTFADVPTTDPFYQYIETAAFNQLVSGYSDGTFRPFNNVTRGQLCKIVVIAAGWSLVNPPIPTFLDVPPEDPFYTYIETAYDHAIISGYSDGTFRPGNNATRGQISKIVYEAVTAP